MTVDNKVVDLFEKATLGRNQQEKTAAAKTLKEINPGVADLVEVFNEARRGPGEQPVSHAAITEKYKDLFDLAKEWSDSPKEAASSQNIEIAVNRARYGSKEDIVNALTGVTNTRATLIAEANAAFSNSHDSFMFEQSLRSIKKMDPDLAQRLQVDIQLAHKQKDSTSVLNVIHDINQGIYDRYGLSKAAYDFNQLAKMDPNSTGYKQTYETAVKENPIIGPYLEGLKKLEVALSDGGKLNPQDQKILDTAQKGFSEKIKNDMPLQQEYIVEAELQKEPALQ